MNLDLTSSSSRIQKSITQKKSYKPENQTQRTQENQTFPFIFHLPKQAITFLQKKKKSCNQSISQPKIIRAPPSPLQVGKITNPTTTKGKA